LFNFGECAKYFKEKKIIIIKSITKIDNTKVFISI
jgi:hypothetical protein